MEWSPQKRENIHFGGINKELLRKIIEKNGKESKKELPYKEEKR